MATSGRAHATAEVGPGATGAALSTGLLPALVGYHLRRAQTAVFKHFAQVVGAAEDITPGLFGMLQVIAANPGLCQSRLAEAMGVDRSTIVSVLHQLEARGLVERQPSPEDRRSHALHLTRKGRQALRRMEALVLVHEEEIAAALSPAERRTLLELLARLYQS
ncbi:MAG TPA: MarR family transcriptional regulator [Gemmatimonadales bacterium]